MHGVWRVAWTRNRLRANGVCRLDVRSFGILPPLDVRVTRVEQIIDWERQRIIESTSLEMCGGISANEEPPRAIWDVHGTFSYAFGVTTTEFHTARFACLGDSDVDWPLVTQDFSVLVVPRRAVTRSASGMHRLESEQTGDTLYIRSETEAPPDNFLFDKKAKRVIKRPWLG
jgi:hypothetical protein